MPLDAKALQRANNLLEEIERLDRAATILGRCKAENTNVRVDTQPDYSGNEYTLLKIPSEFAKALIFYARAQKYDELRRTGIVSTTDATVRQIIK